MAHPNDPLPPLTALQTFESAARHLSFKTAAAELNVTAGAVSHQIKSLEANLDRPLFNRIHRGVELTPEGKVLAEVMHRSLKDISSVLAQIRRANQDRSVTIGATTAVSSLWLTPRLSRFWKEHGSISVDQQVSDTQSDPDPATDFVVRYGENSGSHQPRYPLFHDQLLPLCSPEFLQSHSATTLLEMAALPLVHLDAHDADWTTWRTWFDQLGFADPLAKGIRVNNYTIALQTARDGLGLVLGWERLTEPLIASGELVAFGDWKLEAPGSFYIQTRSNEALSSRAQIVLDWLLASV